MARPAAPWAATLLVWRDGPRWREATASRVTYFVAPARYETLAWAELRDWGGKHRIEIGAFGSVAEAEAACEADAQRRVRR
jgi:hypothetical protein